MRPSATQLLTNPELFYMLEDLIGRVAAGRFDQRDVDHVNALRGEVALRALRN